MKRIVSLILTLAVFAFNCVPLAAAEGGKPSKLERVMSPSRVITEDEAAEPDTPNSPSGDITVNAEGLTPFGVYEGIMETVNSLESYITDLYLEMSMQIPSLSINMDLTMEAEQGLLGKDDGSFDYYMLSVTSGMGMEETVNMWYQDGIVYTETGGDKVKLAMNETDFKKQFSIPEPDQRLFTYEEAVMEQWFEEEDGKTVLCFIVDAKKGIELAEGDMSAFMPMDIGDLDISGLDEVQIRVILNADGGMELMSLEYGFTYEEMGVEAAADIYLTMSIYEPGEGSVEFPDFSEFHY
ncbi:MAG: hypothetical protein LBS19_08010 [Clostridiales bacterium]|jgi:hypothetical protein|nr:hypothetical protein [Clostridiales bacterium]